MLYHVLCTRKPYTVYFLVAHYIYVRAYTIIMPLEESLILVNAILSIIAVIVSAYLIPKLHSDLVTGWKLIVLGLVIFAINQFLKVIGNDSFTVMLNTLFVIVFIIGLFIHLTKIMEHTQAERVRK